MKALPPLFKPLAETDPGHAADLITSCSSRMFDGAGSELCEGDKTA